jgi:hypothetical protein
MNVLSVQEEAVMNTSGRLLLLFRVVLLLTALSLGLWFTASGLQLLIADPSALDGPQLLRFVTGLVFFFGGIASGIIVLHPARQ